MSGAARIPRHGRNHMPGGSDPIPGMTGGGSFTVEVQAFSSASTSVSNGGGSYTDLNWGSPSGDSLVTVDGGGAFATFNADGFYVVECTIMVASLAAAATCQAYIDYTNAGTQYTELVGQSGVSQVHAGICAIGQGGSGSAVHIAGYNNDSSSRTFQIDSLRIFKLS